VNENESDDSFGIETDSERPSIVGAKSHKGAVNGYDFSEMDGSESASWAIADIQGEVNAD